MRSTCSLYIDAGYLLASAATRVTGTSLRNGIHVDYTSLIAALIQEAEHRAGMPVLRVHWYDSARNGVPDAQQERIGELSRVKLRLGRFGMEGQQKGVDLRIGLDMVAHARNAASDIFFLVSGDDDLTEAVEDAQVHGVQVSVLAVPAAGGDGKPHGVSRHLVRAADELTVLQGSLIDKVVMRVQLPQPAEVTTPRPIPSPAALAKNGGVPTPLELADGRRTHVAPKVALAYSGTTGGPSQVMPGYDDVDEYEQQISKVVEQVLETFRDSASAEGWADLLRSRPSIPRDVDRAMLLDASDELQMYDLTDPIRYRLRDRFWELVDQA